jgi:ubiquinone/menaquinone biosynthesis C-methylase UbiE
MTRRQVKLQALDKLGLGINGISVFEALRPFVVSPDAQRFTTEMRLRQRRLGKRLVQRIGTGWLARRRSLEKVRTEYDTAWQAGHSRYDTAQGPLSFTPWRWGDRDLLVDAAGPARMRSLMFGAVIKALKPRTVLEVGCGDGINMFLLAGAFPDVSFTGLELTDAGHTAARRLQHKSKLPEHLLSYAPLAQRDKEAFKRISFVQGNALTMPYQTGTFDLVMTVLSVEQMERIRVKALREIARVTGGHLLSLEPFSDVNNDFLRRLNVISRDYFRGSIASLRDYGLDPIWATADFPQEVFLGSALVLSRKMSPKASLSA